MSREHTGPERSRDEGQPGDPHDAGIRLGNEEALDEGGLGPMSHTYGAGGLGTGGGVVELGLTSSLSATPQGITVGAGSGCPVGLGPGTLTRVARETERCRVGRPRRRSDC